MELGYEIQIEQKQQLTQGQIQSLEILAMDGRKTGEKWIRYR